MDNPIHKFIDIYLNDININIKNKIMTCPFSYIIFGSKTSIDLDIIVQVPIEFTQLDLQTNVFNTICEELDELLKTHLNQDKEINSSLGYWTNGVLIWCQKGSDIAEVNNSLIETFNNHKQLLTACPITIKLERNVNNKIHCSIRTILCKMSKTALINGQLIDIILGVFSIPEIRKDPKLKVLLDSIFCGITITKPRQAEILQLLPNARFQIAKLDKSKDKRNKTVKMLDTAIRNNFPIRALVEMIIDLNKEEVICVNDLIMSLDNLEIINELKQSVKNFTISINRIIRLMRRKQEIGIRVDMLKLLDFRNFVLTKDPLDRMKCITFQLGQTLALLNGIELYDKEYIAKMYPILGTFLRREIPTEKELMDLTEFTHIFLEKIMAYPGIIRESREVLRFNH